MNQLAVRVAGPALLLGFFLAGTCLVAAWQINRLQRGMARLLPANVTAVEAAQKLEILQRDLRVLMLQMRLGPTPNQQHRLEHARLEFEATLREARLASSDPEQLQVLAQAEQAFRSCLDEASIDQTLFTSPDQIRSWLTKHPVTSMAGPCQQLIEMNNREMRETVSSSDLISRWTQAALLLFCMLGLVGGFLVGFGTARSMHQSISRMLVLVRDVHAQLDEEVGLLDLDAMPSLDILDHRLARFVDRVREVTRQVQHQQQEILRSEQLAAVGQLAAAVAHEIRNPLTGIKLLVERAQKRLDSPGLSPKDLSFIHRELVRLERTAQDLLDYARPPALHARVDDLRPTIRRAVELVAARANQIGTQIHLGLPDSAILAWHDPDQVTSILTNLLVNALDVLRQGGEISVSVRARLDRFTEITVSDSGPGIPEDLLPRLFTPFMSTKQTGTGLGLSLSRRIARQHGGELLAANHPSVGACFTLTLPNSAPEGANAPRLDRGR